MPQFAYEARTEEGQHVGGMITPADIEEAGAKLSASNHFVVKLGLAGPVEPQGRARDFGTASRLKAKRRSVMWFISQLAIMIETGIAIGEALDVMARQSSDPIMGEVLAGVSTRVQECRPVSDARDHYARTFPPIVRCGIRA